MGGEVGGRTREEDDQDILGRKKDYLNKKKK